MLKYIRPLKMMMDMMAGQIHWPNSRCLSGRTSFNKRALEDTFIWASLSQFSPRLYFPDLITIQSWTTGRQF